jgi:hypothetical protein
VGRKKELILYNPFTLLPSKQSKKKSIFCIVCKKPSYSLDNGCCFKCSAKRSVEENYGGLIGDVTDGPSNREVELMNNKF